MLTHDEVLARLRERIGTEALWRFGAEHGFSGAYLCNVLKGKTKITPRLGRVIGIEVGSVSRGVRYMPGEQQHVHGDRWFRELKQAVAHADA